MNRTSTRENDQERLRRIRARARAWGAASLFSPRNRRVHEGWNEDTLPYVYRQRWLDGEPSSPEHAGNAGQFSESCDHQVLSREDRVRGLSRVWYILQYFYPYFNIVCPDPDKTLLTWIPKVEAAEDPEGYYAVLERFIATLNDSHARIVSPIDEPQGRLPVTFAYVGGKVVISGMASEHGDAVGAEVLALNGTALPALKDTWRTRISASSPQAFTRDFLGRLCMGSVGTQAEMTLCSASGSKTITLAYGEKREPEDDAPSPGIRPRFAGFSWLKGTAYLRRLAHGMVYMSPFDMPDAQTLRSAFDLIRATRGLVLDLRGYPATHFQHELVRCLCDTPVRSPRYEIPVVSDPDLRKRTWKLVQHTIQPDGRPVYDKPVVALIDETTQSSAEDFCMYLQIARRVTFVGCPTAGCVGNLTTLTLPGGGWASFTGMRVTWPDGSPMWGCGIQPDVRVEQTLAGLKAGRDDVLEMGIDGLGKGGVNFAASGMSRRMVERR